MELLTGPILPVRVLIRSATGARDLCPPCGDTVRKTAASAGGRPLPGAESASTRARASSLRLHEDECPCEPLRVAFGEDSWADRDIAGCRHDSHQASASHHHWASKQLLPRRLWGVRRLISPPVLLAFTEVGGELAPSLTATSQDGPLSGETSLRATALCPKPRFTNEETEAGACPRWQQE